jgi:uncharacterized protein involved in exopolysaccharide biosynthesis
MSVQQTVPQAEDIDLGTLGRAVWRAKGWIFGLAALVGVATFVILSTMRPLYTSEARILIENDVSPFTRAATDDRNAQRENLNEQAVESQVQVLTSRDLALEVVKQLDLINNPAFAKDAGTPLLARLLDRFGLGGSDKSKEEKAADAFEEHLSVYVLTKSNVIAVNYTSGDPQLASKAANTLAEAYLSWQRHAKLLQTKDATTWLSSQIEELRKKVAGSEAAVEQFRSDHGLYEGTNKTPLNAQQLSELNSQLILAKAQRSETEARARLIREMLEDNADIDATPEVLKSELITRLIEQRALVQRQLAELSATLLPSHPRMQQLASELNDIRMQIRQEAGKIVQGLESEAEIASAREGSLRDSLKEAQSQASGQSDAEIKLRALEREAKANRDLLESYLARYRDASTRYDVSAVPASATIVSRAHPATKPSFPKRGPMSALAAAATALLGLAFVLSRELIGGEGRVAAPMPVGRREPEPLPQRRAAVRARRANGGTALRPEELHSEETEKDVMSPIDTPRRGRVPPAPSEALEEAWRGKSEEAAASPGLFQKMRNAVPNGMGKAPLDASPHHSPPQHQDLEPDTMSPPNDLRSYLRQKAALQAVARTRPPRRNQESRPRAKGTVGPVVKSIDSVLGQIRSRSSGDAARAVLVVPASSDLDATDEAIRIARALARRERAVLVDLARGPAAVSGLLGLPRAPGFTDLAAGRAGFEDVVQTDFDTSLQVLPAGNPHVKSDEEEVGTGRIVDALSQVYDRLVLHIDRDTLRKLDPALGGRLQLVVAVIAPGDRKHDRTQLDELTALGCQVVPYEQTDGEHRPRRSGFFGRAAAV